MYKQKKYKELNTPVLLTFFIKYETLEQVFAMIRQVRPKILFLVGDGSRPDHPDDMERIKRCRQIVDNVDWECDVHKYYQDENKGILYNSSYGLTKAFEIVDRLIFLEDDKLPSKSFFYFCDELLERYKDDLRILRICGGNHCGIYENCESDYFFARYPYSGAAGLWKRGYEGEDREFMFVENKYTKECMKRILPPEWKKLVAKAEIERECFIEDGLPKSFELIDKLEFYLQNRCNLYPKYNMIIDLGCAKGSEHYPDDIRKVPKAVQRLIMNKNYEIAGELRHPKYVVPDTNFEQGLLKKQNSVLHELVMKMESFFRIWYYGSLDEAVAGLKRYLYRKLHKGIDKNGC